MLKLLLGTLLFSSLIARAENPMRLTDYLAQPASPMKVNIVLDEAQTTSLKIKAQDGGTLKLKTKSGDEFTLSIPPLALSADTEITMTAISKFSESTLNLSTSASGVSLSPEGIEFLKPVTLTIVRATPIDSSIIVPVTTYADGSEASLASIDPKPTDANVVNLTLFHFSTYTIFGSQTARETISKAFNSLTTNRISSYIADQLTRQKNGLPVDKDFVWDSMKEVVDKVLTPQLNNIESCAGGIDVIRAILGLTRQGQLLGLNTDYLIDPSKLEVAQKKTGNKCKERAFKACYDEHRPFDVFNNTITYLRQNQLMGIQNDPIEKELSDLTLKCLNFDIEIFSTFSLGSNDMGISTMGKANIKLPNLFEPFITTGTVQVKKFDFNPDGLTCTQKSMVNPPEDVKISLFMNDMRFDQSLGLYISPLTPTAKAVFTCVAEDGTKMDIPLPGGMGSPDDSLSFWGGLFQTFHSIATKNEFNPKKGRYEIWKWDVHYSELFAEKHYKQTYQEMDEETDFFIYHRPLN